MLDKTFDVEQPDDDAATAFAFKVAADLLQSNSDFEGEALTVMEGIRPIAIFKIGRLH